MGQIASWTDLLYAGVLVVAGIAFIAALVAIRLWDDLRDDDE